ncbi:MAG: DsrE family protein [Alphaproteobacteria bacterium]|uniref:DsrE family protein n=1 Tax=Candidatus Nitrobium versatile TaxID=2884831 RepID=A0A953JCK1_9BACT|nr:DsrE family protein [Candidatus Nitrobium versatile]
MGKITILLKRSPYGDINAAEAVRHAMGAAAGELSVDIVLTDSGVLLAKKGQDDTGTGFTNLGAALKDCLDMGIAVYADKPSLREYRLDAADMIEGVAPSSSTDIAGLIKEAATVILF